MASWFAEMPARWYLLAILLPLIAFTLQLIAGSLRFALRPYCKSSSRVTTLYWMLGGDQPLRLGGYLSFAAMLGATICSVIGWNAYLANPSPERWSESFDWVNLSSYRIDDRPSLRLTLGYHIDMLTVVMFTMVTSVGSCIFLFSMGYMKDELQKHHHDHEAHVERRGRYGRFFLFLSLFVVSMLHLLIADNLFQVFVSWELVGVCSFFLIGFYYERNSAAIAAIKAFIMNRIGDAGFLVGIAIIWTTFGTLQFTEMFQRVRSPETDAHGALPYAHQMVRVDQVQSNEYQLPKEAGTLGSYVVLHPILTTDSHFHGMGPGRKQTSYIELDPTNSIHEYNVIPYWLLTLAGLGIFFGCVGKSAQFPLHTWLPDAMEGPTPVSALIHAATMVAAGVYLVARCFPLFTNEVLMVIAYVGGITLFLGATVALVMNDIKRVLAYSTVSQLGYMMLALGMIGWVPGVTHLITHACFKALLFMCAGSVIYACHHEQDMRRMGGLIHKMPITGYTMLVGVFAIVGMPLMSGWYSKDAILATALGYYKVDSSLILLCVIPFVAAIFTSFYMFRLWFLVFLGQPRDQDVYDHAHESPWMMTVPLVILAGASIGVAWGWPIWDVDASGLARLLASAQPPSIEAEYGELIESIHDSHHLAGILAFVTLLIGAVVAAWYYLIHAYTPNRLPLWGFGHKVLQHKWFFDELYQKLFTRPVVRLASQMAQFDKAPDAVPSRPTLDAFMSLPARLIILFSNSLRRFQTGRIRSYIVALGLTVLTTFAILLLFHG